MSKSNIIVSAPAATARVTRNSSPTIVRRSQNEIVVSHREHITELSFTADANFANTIKQVTLQPGNQATFPWLSTIANSYESYRFERCKFTFESSLPTSIVGGFIMAFDYDAADAPPSSRSDFLNYKGAVKGPIWSPSLEMVLSPKDLNKIGPSRYTAAGSVTGDPKTYHAGILSYTCVNANTATGYGDLFVEYTIVLQTPQVNSRSRTTDSSWSCQCPNFTSNATCFDGANISGRIPITCSGNTMTFNRTGRYLISARMTSSSATSPTFGFVGSTYATLSQPGGWTTNITDSINAAYDRYVDVLAVGATIQTALTGLGASNNADFLVVPFDLRG